MISNENLDSRYLSWLQTLIGPSVHNRNPARSYSLLAEQLFMRSFEWSVPNDDNRIEDGRDLREEFLAESGARRDRRFLGADCSMLELLIALARRAEFESSKDSYTWFWQMIDNIGLRICTDDVYSDEIHDVVDDMLDQVINRTYEASGRGGLFPLNRPDKDQREVELWYQLQAYLLENGFE